jgi:hypothetical protein
MAAGCDNGERTMMDGPNRRDARPPKWVTMSPSAWGPQCGNRWSKRGRVVKCPRTGSSGRGRDGSPFKLMVTRDGKCTLRETSDTRSIASSQLITRLISRVHQNSFSPRGNLAGGETDECSPGRCGEQATGASDRLASVTVQTLQCRASPICAICHDLSIG